ncbi:MAG: adenylate/guanylate cyclase domain-containing protein, partial [Alphaproteobacteria bacterium]|nr:adenylate/guanylate cyclase domain-containing protein [Alphaproteobacteria bacterium]
RATERAAQAEAQKAQDEARRWAEAQQDAPPPAQDEPPPTPATYGDEPDEPPSGEGEGAFERQRLLMMRFLGGVVSAIKAVRPQLDAFNKFGVDLMLAGGIDVLGERTGLGGEDRRKILRETIEVLGTKASMAQTFVDKYEEYLLEARYMQMVQSGRDAMTRHMADEPGAFGELAQAIDAWNRPTGTTQMQQGIITVMFTDIVGSTDMTQAKGDHAAQGIVRLHNSIVRAALAEFGGREVKHTGDGIMASFGSASSGVSATVAIQRSIWEHNAKNPSLPLKVRIGINAGEPIVEEDDLFGTTVQLAARVCAKAGADEIFCSNVVRELAAGKGFQFGSQGDHDLKGFPEPVPLYEILWNPAIAAASPSTDDMSGKSD